MRVRIKAFATAAEALESRDLELDIPTDTTVASLLDLLVERAPALDATRARLAVAVDGALAPPDRVLEPDQEVALLPPVSGGDPSVDESQARARLVHRAIEAAELASGGDVASGAEVVFVGRVRNDFKGRLVLSITYDAYESMAAARLETICQELSNGGLEVRILHRLGNVAAGEASVVISARAPHRAEAFEGCRLALERLKREAPIWKKERYSDGSFAWREEELLSDSAGTPSSIT